DVYKRQTLDDVRRARQAYYQQPARSVLDVLTDARYPHVVILGDPGSGKSTLARYVALSLIDSTTSDARLQKTFAGYLPLLIELRMFVGLCAENKCESFLEFLDHLGKTEGWGLTRDALHRYLKDDGRALVLFDGLDEIFDPEQRERVTRQIVGWTNDYPKTRVIVTSRVIGYRRKILTDAGFAHFTLQDLDKPQVETFVNRWYDLALPDRPEARTRRERVLKAFEESASIRQLAGNPMLLTIMAIIGKHQELPRERWKLYDHAASVLIYQWDVNRHLRDARIQADFIGEEDKKELLRRLAYQMQGGDVRPQTLNAKLKTLNLKPETLNLKPETSSFAGNYIHRDELQAVFEGYLRERYAQPPDRAKVIAETMIQQFRERNFILAFYGANLYGFVHRAFLEYFCASAFVHKFEKTKELTIEQLKTEVYGARWHDPQWHEVLRLICGIVDERWAGEIIMFLIQANPDWQKKKQLPWHIALALHCLSEVRNPSAIPNAVSAVLESLFSLFEFETSTYLPTEHSKFIQEQIDTGIATLSTLPTEEKLEALLEQFRPGALTLRYAT
ncbi:MAG: NACHT domain-containing protein, partial [Anaerolineae bacterium]|nr:NACHT domain-containing protein [Anaerolineae bacterium]